jgi:septum formation protein
MSTARTVYLASRSPRRVELLAQIGIHADLSLMHTPEGLVREMDESPREDEVPMEYVKRVARMKVSLAWHRLNQRGGPMFPVLAADTAVVLEGRILGKPADAGVARDMLRALSGKAHEVFTAVAVKGGDALEIAVSVSRVEFRGLFDEEIERYVESGEPMDKAGAYGIQGLAAAWIARLEGSYSGVMGLPLFETSELLARLGLRVV